MATTKPAPPAAAAAVAPASEAESSTGPHRLRITSGGSMSDYIKFALDFLQNHPDRPLVLHTRPVPPGTASAAAGSKQPRSTSTLQPCTKVVPKLISVAETIKREYMSILESTGKGKGKHRAVGIWQYTKSGLVDPSELGLGLDGTEGNNGLARVLEGKTKPKMTHYPYLEITLSSKPLGLEKETNTSCQYLLTARHRAARKSKEGPEDANTDGVADSTVLGEEEDDLGIGEVIPRVPLPAAAAPQPAAISGGPVLKPVAVDSGEGGDEAEGIRGKKRKVKTAEHTEPVKTKKAKGAVAAKVV